MGLGTLHHLPVLLLLAGSAGLLPLPAAGPPPVVHDASGIAWDLQVDEDGTRSLRVGCTPGRRYTVEQSSDLVQWTPLRSWTGLAPGQVVAVDLFVGPPPVAGGGAPPPAGSGAMPLTASLAVQPVDDGSTALCWWRGGSSSYVRILEPASGGSWGPPTLTTLHVMELDGWTVLLQSSDLLWRHPGLTLPPADPPLAPDDAAFHGVLLANRAAIAAAIQGIHDNQQAALEHARLHGAPPAPPTAGCFFRVREESGIDSDGDGLTDEQELALGLNIFFTDTDGDGMDDRFEVVNGLNGRDNSDDWLDADSDGLANIEEARLGTDPHNDDTDGDGVKDDADAVANVRAIDWTRTPESGYAWVQITGAPLNSDALTKAQITNDPVVLFGPGLTSGGFYTPKVFWDGTTVRVLEGGLPAEAGDGGWVLGYRAPPPEALPPYADDPQVVCWVPGSSTALEVSASDLRANDSYQLIMRATGAWGGGTEPRMIGPDGRLALAAQSWDGSAMTNHGQGLWTPTLDGQGGCAWSFAPVTSPDGFCQAVFAPDGTLVLHGSANDTLRRPDGTTLSGPGGFENYWTTPTGRLAVVNRFSGMWRLQDGTGAWISPEPIDDGPLSLFGGRKMNRRGEVLDAVGGRLWRNGKWTPLADLLPPDLKAAGWQVTAGDINDNGVIVIGLRTAGAQAGSDFSQVGLLVPMGFENPRRSVHEIQTTTCGPRILLDDLAAGDVTISEDGAKVVVSGTVLDSVSAMFPPSGQDPTTLRVYLNGVLLPVSGQIQRQSSDQGFWKPYGDTFAITPFEVVFPASGVNLLRVETGPNVAGLSGHAEFEVAFRTEATARPGVPPAIVEQDLILEGPLDPEEPDTVSLAAPDGPPIVTLTETGSHTGIFVSAQGHALSVSPAFVPTGEVDMLPCSLSMPGVPVSFSMRGQPGHCEETGASTLRFRYTETIPGRDQDSILANVLDGVRMMPVPDERDGWFPLAFASAPIDDSMELEIFGRTFPLLPIDGRHLAATHEGKPLIGCVVRRTDEPTDPEDEPLAPALEFVYFDHDAGAITRVALDGNACAHPWRLLASGVEKHAEDIPWKRISFVDADGEPAPGIIPLPVEALEEILAGGTPEISPEHYAFIELVGHADGEVVRFGNGETPYDSFDIVAGQAESLLREQTRHVRLQKLADRHFLTTQKVIIFCPGESGRQELSASEWLALRDAGFLAIHNPRTKVFWGQEDIEWLQKERSSFHPPDGMKMGIGGVTDPADSRFYRFESFEDHHLFNKFHGDNGGGRALAWGKLFEGEGFDVDEFTVPVRQGVHRKIQHLADKGWRSFIDEVFDSATGQLKPGITGAVLARKRAEAFALMETMVDEMGLELKWVRPYPVGAIANRAASPDLYNRLVNSRGALGESLNRLGFQSSKYLKSLDEEAQAVGQALFKKHVRKFLKTGGKGALHCLPLVFAIQDQKNGLVMLSYSLSLGPKEGAAVWLDLSFELQDLPLARRIVDHNWQMFEDMLAGADARLCAALPSGTVVKVGDPTFTFDNDASGKIVHVTPKVVTNLWQLPDGRVKLRAKMTEPPYSVSEEEDAEWFITDWYPAVGESKTAWLEACERAGANNDYGDP